MTTTIDAAGRIVIPKPLRDRLGLSGGAEVVVAEHDGVIEIRPAPVEVDLVRTGSVTVLQPRSVPALIDEGDVRATLEKVRTE